MFKYLDDKNNIINSRSGIRNKYERLKFNIEKDNLIHSFISKDGISHDVIIDFIKMMQSYSNDGISKSVINFGGGEYIEYNIVPLSKNKISVSMEHYKNNSSILLIKIGIYNNSYDNNTIFIIDNKNNINYDYVLDGQYNNDVGKYIDIVKKYMLYMLEYTLSGGLKNE